MPQHLLILSLAVLGLTSCGLVNSAAQLPSSVLRTVGVQLTATEKVTDDSQENQSTEKSLANKGEFILVSE